MNFKENYSLADLTTLKVGGQAKYFTEVETVDELNEAIKVAQDQSLPIFILAGGSNVIFSDEGFNGLVIHPKFKQFHFEDNRLITDASVEVKDLVEASIDQGYSGLEWAGGLPGTIGGAVRGNAGCFRGETKDFIDSVTSVDIETSEKKVRNNQDCQFTYRGSIFKQVKEVILSVTINLKKGDKDELETIAQDHIAYRIKNHPMEYPNSGSIFKNVPVEKIPKDVLPLFNDVIKSDPFPVVPVAKIINDAGLKGLKVGDAQISEKHTNFIINLGSASTQDVLELIDQAKKTIERKYQIQVEVEPEIVSFN